MPIVMIHSSRPTGSVSNMLAEVRDSGAQALGCGPENVWVTHQETPTGTPPFVLVKALAGRSPEIRAAFARATTEAVARGLATSPKGIWLHFEEMRPHDVWTGGKWASSDR